MVEKTPPESVFERTAPRYFHELPVERRPAAVELIHWAYGAGGGAVFGGLRRRWRAALLTDHMLYGIVVAASPWPLRD